MKGRNAALPYYIDGGYSKPNLTQERGNQCLAGAAYSGSALQYGVNAGVCGAGSKIRMADGAGVAFFILTRQLTS